MATLKSFELQPGEKHDIDIFFDDYVDPLTDSVASIVSVSADSGISVDSGELIGDMVKVWVDLAGAAPGNYNVVASVLTAGGRTKHGDVTIKVREKGRSA